MSVGAVVRSGSIRERVLPVGTGVLLSVVAAESIPGMGSHVPKPLVVVLAIAGGAVLLAVDTVQLFLAWLFVAPLFQESTSSSRVGHVLGLALYTAPPIVLFLKHLLADGKRPRHMWFDVLPLVYFIFLVVSLVGTASSELHTGAVATLRTLYQNVAIGIIVFYLVAFWRGRGPSLVATAKVLLIAAALQAAMAVVEWPTHWNLWHDTRWLRPGDHRSIATLGNPSVAGAFIGVGIVLALSVLCWRGPAQLRRLAVVMLLVGLPGLYATKTRGPVLATVVVALLIVLLSARSRLVGVAAAALAVLLLVVFWPQIRSSSVYQTRLTEQQNVQARIVLQEVSFKLIERKPLLGWGYDSFDRVKYYVSVPSGPLPLDQALKSTSHDTYLTTLVDFGAVGFALFVLPWVAIVACALRRVRGPSPSRWFLVAMLGSIVLLTINGATLDYRFYSFIPMLAWLALGLLRRQLAAPALTS